jgi:hypothetical protein
VGHGDGADTAADNNHICTSHRFWFCDIFKTNK